jgi:uncharacterized iron-regulated membrane protein
MTTTLEPETRGAPSGAPDEVDDSPSEAAGTARRRGPVYRWLAKNRRPVFVVHKWLSLFLLLWVVMECVTGSVLVFRPEINRFLARSDFQATEGDVGTQAAADAALAAHDRSILNDVAPPGNEESGGMYLVGIYDIDGEYLQVVVDPGTGDVTNADYRSPWVVQELADLHFNLNSSSVFGLEGIEAQAWLGVLFLVVMLSGFYLWYWPRMRAWAKLLKIRRGLGRYRWHLDLHNAVGVITIVPLLLITITGINFAFPNQVSAVYDVVTFGAYDNDATEQVVTSEPTGTATIGVEQAQEIVEAIDPSIDVQFVSSTGGSPVASYEVGAYVDAAAIGMLGGQRYVEFHVDQYTGQVLEIHDPATDSAVDRGLDEWAGPIHFGTFGGIVIQLLWVVVGLAVPVLAVTGVVMWLNRRNVRRRRGALTSDAASSAPEAVSSEGASS